MGMFNRSAFTVSSPVNNTPRVRLPARVALTASRHSPPPAGLTRPSTTPLRVRVPPRTRLAYTHGHVASAASVRTDPQDAPPAPMASSSPSRGLPSHRASPRPPRASRSLKDVPTCNDAPAVSSLPV